MKWTGMLVVSLRGVNFGFWSRLGCSGQNVIIFSRQGLVEGCTRRNDTSEMVKIKTYDNTFINYLKAKVFDDKVFAIIKSHCTFYLSVL